MKDQLKGIWRTYKVFCFSGKVQQHNDQCYLQLSISDDGILTQVHSQAKRSVLQLQEDQWRIEAHKKRNYLYFGKRQVYELITVETDGLVLADIMKGEKLFFAKMPLWHCFIQESINAATHIRAGQGKQNNH
jgi:hypothetical protein